MAPQKFNDEKAVSRSYEHVFSDIQLYRKLGDTAMHAIEFGDAPISVREYQTESWAALRQVRIEGKDSALLHLATGLGKTTVGVVDALDFAVDFYEQEGRPPKIMFAVHQTEILQQAAIRFQEFAPSLTQGNYASGSRETNNPLTFATMQFLAQNLDEIDPNEFDYILYDEAHHAQADTYKKVIQHFTPSFKLALTATPDRMDNADIRDLFGEAVYSKPLPEAMVEGYLADVDYHIVFDDAVKRAMDSGFTPQTLGEIRELLTNESRNEEIALQIWDEMDRIGRKDAKTIIFCHDIKQANEMAELLGGRAYHSNTEDRADVLNSFRNNELQIIATRDMFNEGVDVPDAELLVFLRSTSSRTIFEQQLGRGLRKHGEKDSVAVLDFVANIDRLAQVKKLVEKMTEYSPRQNEADEGNGNDSRPGNTAPSTPNGLSITTDHADFDFDKLSVMLLDRINNIETRPAIDIPQSIDEAAALWQQSFGDEEPTHKRINEASKIGLFVSAGTINNLGGINALKLSLGFKERNYSVTIEDIASLWKSNFGDEEPTFPKIREASKNGLFVSAATISAAGGISALKEALGFNVFATPKSIEEAASQWTERFGDEEPSIAKIIEASNKSLFVSTKTIATLGGINALKEALGFENRQTVDNVSDAADLWKQNFGDEMPTSRKINLASKDGQFVSAGTIHRIGGINALKEALGFENRQLVTVSSLEDAADLWRQNFGDGMPTQNRINLASKNGQFVSMKAIHKLGGTAALKQALGFKI